MIDMTSISGYYTFLAMQFIAPEDGIDVARHALIWIDRIKAVGDGTSGHNVEPDRINRGQSMPGRECGGQVALYDGQRYVAVAETRKIANTRELAIQVDRPQKGRTGDLVVMDVIDLHTACAGVSQGSYRFRRNSTILGKSVRSSADKDIQVPALRLWGAAGDGIVEREDRCSSTTEPPSRTWFARRGEVLQ